MPVDSNPGALMEDPPEDPLAEARRAFAKAALKATARIERRILAIRKDLARIDEAEALAARGALFVAEAARAPRGATRLVAIDWSTGEAVEVELALDPSQPARDQLDALFRRGKRLKHGAAIAAERIREAERAKDKLARLVAEATERAETLAAVDALADRARRAAPRDFGLARQAAPDPRSRAKDEGKALPYRTFRTRDGDRILVGKGGEHNDALVTEVARPHDHWLHVKGRTGAHVLVPLEKKAEGPRPEVLLDAAHLAAHFSEARGEPVVEVSHTPRRYVRKPRGAEPGLVTLYREKVVVLRVEEPRLARVLATEETRAL